MKSVWVALALLLPACSGSGAADAPDRQPVPERIVPWDSVVFTNSSWGRPVNSWQVNADGTGYWAETKSANGQPFGPYTVVFHDLAVGEDGVRKLALMMGDIPDPAPSTTGCKEFATDMNYGRLTIASGPALRSVDWNAGCHDAEYRLFMGQLVAADRLVEQWGRAAPVSREEKGNEGKGN